MEYRIPAVCSVALAKLPVCATELAYCKASHRATTVALFLSTGAGLKKIRERIGTRRFLFDLEVLGIRQSRDEPFMKALGQFHREFPGIQDTLASISGFRRLSQSPHARPKLEIPNPACLGNFIKRARNG
jgi:hypothetical protein